MWNIKNNFLNKWILFPLYFCVTLSRRNCKKIFSINAAIQVFCLRGGIRVARWCVFKPKIPIWVNFWGPYIDRKMLMYFMAIWNILRTFGKFYDHLVHFCWFGTFFWFWYHVPTKIWQPWAFRIIYFLLSVRMTPNPMASLHWR
jgi:hypothetical protein